MDVRNIFKAASNRLMADFIESSEVNHQGGKGSLREDAFSGFLTKNLPTRYGIGRGEVINSQNNISGELDIIIHDPLNCPRIISSESHSVFPIESVFGAISVKSVLSSQELADAYSNIVSLNRIVDRSSFTTGGSGLVAGVFYPRPVTAIFAYKAGRSLEAISKQVSSLDKNLSDIDLRPDFVCILGEGIIGPRGKIRGDCNRFQFSSLSNDLCLIRKTERHTLFKIYLQVLQELNQVILRPLDLSQYENMPRLVGPYRVRRHDGFAFMKDGSSQPDQVSKLTLKAIQEIVARSSQCSRKSVFESWLGMIPLDPEGRLSLDAVVCCYNPNSFPPISDKTPVSVAGSREMFAGCFHPYQIYIDGVEYFVDLTALPDGSFEDNPDLTFDELMSG